MAVHRDNPGISKTRFGIYRLLVSFILVFFFYTFKGSVAVTHNSINYLLTKYKSGRAIGLVVGGALEALEANPGQYNLKLKKRKGFIKMALKTGYVI